ncbi:MAG: hypothetical protein CL862_06825 [Cyanobium sp. NAT70]|nr:hypothetical protein [Cyanobium sp. NAT70]|tara:strand:- start:503 stop:685 length:183 start_codon:yes stop_codon:yes gene_type:complete
MTEKLSDRTAILAIFLTLLIVFGLIFSTRGNQQNQDPPILWREQPPSESIDLQQSGPLSI